MKIFHCYYHAIAETVQGTSSSQHAMHITELRETVEIKCYFMCFDDEKWGGA